MNSRTFSNKSAHGKGKPAMPAFKLMAFENEYHRHIDALSREVKRLRGEVGVLAKRYNGAKREIKELVERVRKQPPPAIPERKGMEKEVEEEEREDKMDMDEKEEKERQARAPVLVPTPIPNVPSNSQIDCGNAPTPQVNTTVQSNPYGCIKKAMGWLRTNDIEVWKTASRECRMEIEKEGKRLKDRDEAIRETMEFAEKGCKGKRVLLVLPGVKYGEKGWIYVEGREKRDVFVE